jgi:dihydroorotase
LKELTLTRPDDWHLHLRDDAVLDAVLESSAADFSRAIVMPNLVPPVVTHLDAIQYRQRILKSRERLDGAASHFEPLMTLYLTEGTDPEDLRRAHAAGDVTAVKLYPAGATTNSASGVKHIRAVYPVLEMMQREGIVLCVHGEVTDSEIDIFDREAVFIERVLMPTRQAFPELRMVSEHVTTADGVAYVQSQERFHACTITPHHLLLNRNHMLVGGIRPHYYCLPILKRQQHQAALVAAATSGDERFFLGTDSAPHHTSAKESACGCAGVFNAPNTMSVLATVFEEQNALENLEAFTSLNGPKFYGLEPNASKMTLVRTDEPVTFSDSLVCGDESITVFDPGFPLYWQVSKRSHS